jgi:circadian clock protein KaiB
MTKWGYAKMVEKIPADILAELEDSTIKEDNEKYILCLCVAGQTPKSTKAIVNIKRICEQELKGRFELEIVDVYQESMKVKDEQLFALPTLIKRLPYPLRKIIGDLSDTEKVLVSLDLRPKGKLNLE